MTHQFEVGDVVRVRKVIFITDELPTPKLAHLVQSRPADSASDNLHFAVNWLDEPPEMGERPPIEDGIYVNTRHIDYVPDDEVPDWVWSKIALRALTGEVE